MEKIDPIQHSEEKTKENKLLNEETSSSEENKKKKSKKKKLRSGSLYIFFSFAFVICVIY